MIDSNSIDTVPDDVASNDQESKLGVKRKVSFSDDIDQSEFIKDSNENSCSLQVISKKLILRFLLMVVFI